MRKITEEFLLEIFSLCLKDYNYFQAIRPYLKVNYIIDEDYRRVWELIIKLYQEKKKRPTYGSILQRLADNNNKGKNDNLMVIVQEIKATIVTSVDNTLNEFEEFIRQNKFIELYQETGKLFNENQRDKAYHLFEKGAEDFTNFSMASGKFERVFADYKFRQMDRAEGCNSDIVTIPFMIPEIDFATHGGAATGETELWLGDSGVGKSKLLSQRSVSSARAGYSVLHIQAEGTKKQCFDNLDACWTGQDYADFRRGGEDLWAISAAKERLRDRIVTNIGGEIYVKAFEQFGKVTTRMIIGWIEDLLKKGVDLRHVVIDYLDLITPESDYIAGFGTGQERERFMQMETARQFKSIATTYKILLTTATQSSDIPFEFSEDESNVLKRNHLGNAKRKVEPFSYFFTINQSPRERRAQQVRVHAEKLREHIAGDTWRFKQSLKNSRFYDKMGTQQLLLEDAAEEEAVLEDIKKERGQKGKKKNVA